MERKSAAGNIRNKERSKMKFLEAVGKILKTKGYAGLKVNNIAEEAGVDKKMIYTYFGGLDGLIDEYIRMQDYWSRVTAEEVAKIMPTGEDDEEWKLFTKQILMSQFDYVYSSEEAQKLLLWRLSEPRASLAKLTATQEENGEHLFKLIDYKYTEYEKEFRSIMAIMVSGLYYLNMFASVNGSLFCGIDVDTEEGREKIKEAISFMVDQSYTKL
ncbi:TetR/AcrR family transcriptional regulator [Chryseobacterium sp. Mn2064]|uniref:TetR/AcrR family transcriptional regulator n=1 Tax=Chryseobacterium sp. Mn2064 TaxID=3395263 RepID=UPI003BC0C374